MRCFDSCGNKAVTPVALCFTIFGTIASRPAGAVLTFLIVSNESDMRGSILVLKAEMALGYQLVSRHRAPRFAAALAAAFLVASVAAGSLGTAGYGGLLPQVAATVAAVAGSRVLAHGAALGAARHAPCALWLVVAGRFAGVMVIVVPAVVVLGAVLLAGLPSPDVVSRIVLAVLTASTAVGVAMAVTSILGASAGSAAGLMAAWASQLPLLVGADAAGSSVAGLAVLLAMAFPDSTDRSALVTLVLGTGWMVGTLTFATWSISRRRAPGA